VLVTDRGLVLRAYALRETSKIIGILGFEHGRVRLVAHGGRSSTSRFAASLEPGNEVEIVYSAAPGRELGTLREATLRRRWLAGLGRIEPLGVGLAMLELLDRLVPEGAGEPALAQATLEAFVALQAHTDRAGALLLFYAFELRVLAALGLRPELGACAHCGKPAHASPGRLDLDAGAWFCRDCAGGGGRTLAVSREVATLLARLAAAPLGAAGTDAAGSASEATTPRVRRLAGLALHRLLSIHLERYRYPRSLQLLKKVDGGGGRGATDVSFSDSRQQDDGGLDTSETG
jgi:DNA repair protein RecO (recombination protein O)